MNKFLKLFFALVIATTVTLPAAADFKEHFDLGQSYLSQYQYSGAIDEFKSALRINYLDNSARIGLVNSYLSRGTDYANKDRNWQKAADDYRSALFYLMYFIYPFIPLPLLKGKFVVFKINLDMISVNELLSKQEF